MSRDVGRWQPTRYPDAGGDVRHDNPWRNRVAAIHIVSFRQIEQLKFDIAPQMTTLIGLNGSGKSSILAALAENKGDFSYHSYGYSMAIDPPRRVDRLISDAILGLPANPADGDAPNDSHLKVFEGQEAQDVFRLLTRNNLLAQAMARIFWEVLGEDTGQEMNVQAGPNEAGPLVVVIRRYGRSFPLYHTSKGTIEVAVLAILIASRRALAEERREKEDGLLKQASKKSLGQRTGMGGVSRSKWKPYAGSKNNTVGNGGGTHFVSTQPGLLLLDEPAVSLHPRAQKKLLEYLKDYSKLQQILMVTHSPFLVDLEAQRLSEVLVVESESGQVRVRKLLETNDQRALIPWREALGLEMTRQVLLEHPTLLLEGQSDRHYLSATSGWCGVDLRPGCGLVVSGGTRKMVTTVAALLSFDTARGRSSELIVLLDSDANNADANQIQELVTRVVLCGDHSRFQEESGLRLGEIEDLFEPGEYLHLFLRRFPEYAPLAIHESGPPPTEPHIRVGNKSITKAIDEFLKGRKDVMAGKLWHAEVSQQLEADPALLPSLGFSKATQRRFASLIHAINLQVDEIRQSRSR